MAAHNKDIWQNKNYNGMVQRHHLGILIALRNSVIFVFT